MHEHFFHNIHVQKIISISYLIYNQMMLQLLHIVNEFAFDPV